MDRAHETGSTSSTRQRLRPCRRRGRHRADHRQWFAQGGTPAQTTVLATKVYGTWGSGRTRAKLSALNIRRACDASLRRLKTDYIDLYQMHHVDRDTPWDEIWEAMEVLRSQGKILSVGSSNFAGWHIAKAQAAAAHRHFLGLVSEQSIYNLFARDVEMDVLPAARDYGVGVIAWSPLHGGLLGGVVRKEREGSRRYQGRAKDDIERRRPQLEQYEDLCAEVGEEPATVALAWLLSRPPVTGPIIGPRTPDQFDGALRAVEITLDRQGALQPRRSSSPATSRHRRSTPGDRRGATSPPNNRNLIFRLSSTLGP